jgi:ATP-dependent Clp protease ATP-binding subunit ClpA
MPPKVLNILKPIIDYRDNVDGIDFRDSVFIFLSNTGAELINEHFLDFWNNKGMKREELKLSDFEKLITKGAFNEEGLYLLYIQCIFFNCCHRELHGKTFTPC